MSVATVVIPDPRPTTFIDAPQLSARVGAKVVLASETMQWTGSFAFRGAYHLVRHIPHRVVISASSGNFGAALALACQHAGKRCRIVMATTASRVKMDAVRAYGGVLELCDLSVMTREAKVRECVQEEREAYIATPHDDPLVIAGYATLGYQLAARAFDAVIAPIGGGGLAAGIVTGLEVGGRPTPMWVAEPALANDFARSLATGRIVPLKHESSTIADGARGRRVGVMPWAVLQSTVHGAIEVSEDAIRDAMRMLFTDAHLKAEPTGALSVAALLSSPSRFRGAHVCCIVSGGNVDANVYERLLAV